jgi:hypothetical protein
MYHAGLALKCGAVSAHLAHVAPETCGAARSGRLRSRCNVSPVFRRKHWGETGGTPASTFG